MDRETLEKEYEGLGFNLKVKEDSSVLLSSTEESEDVIKAKRLLLEKGYCLFHVGRIKELVGYKYGSFRNKTCLSILSLKEKIGLTRESPSPAMENILSLLRKMKKVSKEMIIGVSEKTARWIHLQIRNIRKNKSR